MSNRIRPALLAFVLVAVLSIIVAVGVLLRGEPAAEVEGSRPPNLRSDGNPQIAQPHVREEVANDAAAVSPPGQGEVRLIQQRTRLPPDVGKWVFSEKRDRDSGNEGDLILDADVNGIVRPPLGKWSIRDSLNVYEVMADPVVVEDGVGSVVFVRRIEELQFRVVDNFGSPIPGAQCRWTTYKRSDPGPWELARTETRHEAITDALGSGTIAGCPTGAGLAEVQAPGFAPCRRSISGAVELPLRITLFPSDAVPMSLRFTSSIDGSLLHGLSVLDGDSIIGTVDDGSGEVSIPDFLPRNKTLLVKGPTVCDSSFRLSSVKNNSIAVAPRCTLRVLLPSGQPGKISITSLEARANPGEPMPKAAQGRAFPRLPRPQSTAGREEVELSVPQGVPLGVLYLADSAETAFVELVCLSSTRELDLRPQLRSDVLAITVTGDAGESSPAAVANVSASNGGQMRLPIDDASTIRVPVDLEPSYLEIVAKGYVPVGLRYKGSARRPQPGTAWVQLQRGIQLPVVITDPAGNGIPGLRIVVWRHSSNDVALLSVDRGAIDMLGWELVNGRALEGSTDSAGRCVFSGVIPGLIDIEVGLGTDYSPDNATVSAYAARLEAVMATDQVPISIVLGSPMSCEFEVLEETTGLPVTQFQVTVEPGGAKQAIMGSYLSAWIPETLDRLEFFAPSIGRASVPRSALSSTNLNRVLIRPDKVLSISLRGAAEIASMARLDVLLLQRSERGGMVVMSNASLPVVAGAVSCAAPTQEPWFIGLPAPFVIESRTFRVTPSQHPLVVGGHVEFVFERQN